MARPIAHYVVSMGVDGSVVSQGSASDVLEKDSLLLEEVVKEEEVLAKVESEIDSPPPADEPKTDGKLILAEEVEVGHVGWEACTSQNFPIC